MKPRNFVTLALLSMALLLAACTQPQPTVVTPGGFVRLSVTLDTGNAASDELSPAGLPFDPSNGTINLREVRVRVLDRSGDAVAFRLDGSAYTADPSGLEAVIELTTASSSATVLLPAAGNPYTFESVSFSTSDNAIGYDRRSQHVNVNGTVAIRLKSVLGAATLTPRFPTHYATPGMELDLMLFVAANGHPDLQVPIGDFETAYDTVSGGTQLSESNRGIRIKAASACTDVGVTGAVTGVRETSGSFNTNETSPIAPFTLECVPASVGSLAVDVQPPTVEVLGFNPTTGRIEGVADDNVAIVKVQIYDGPELVASTDDSEVSIGAALIIFQAGTGSFHADLTPTPDSNRSFQAIALDASGNEGRSAETQNLSFVYVSTSGNNATATGAADKPFATIAAAMNAVNEGGTIYVQDGTYDLPTLNIMKSLTLRGESEAGTILNANRPSGPVPGYGMEVTADRVTLESFTLEGPGAGSVQGRGIHAAGNPVATKVLQGLVIRNVTVDGARQMGLSINTTNGTVLENVTVKNVNAGNEGIGINLKSTHNALLRNVTTSNNTVGISVETTKTAQEYANNDSRNITISGGSHSDLVGVMTEIYSGREVTGLSLDPALGYGYAVRNPTPLTARDTSSCTASGTQYTYYVKNLTEATALATEFCDPTQTTVQEVSALDAADLLAFTVPQGLSIQAAVDAASAGATINIEAGTHTSSGVNVGTPSLKIVGASAGTTVIQGNNPDGLDTTSGFDYGFSLSAANIEISGLHLQDYYADVNLGNAPGAYLHDLEFSSSRIAIRTPTLHNIDGLRFEDSSIHDTNSGILLQHGKTNPTPARHVTFDGLTFADVAHKGMYLEAFTDSTIQNIVMNRVGNGYGPDNVETPPSTALELNLKYHDHGTVTLSNIEINDSGWSNATADYSGATTPTHINAAALAIAVRDDGGYATNPAALSNLVLNDITITGAYRAIRLGEAKVLEPASVFTTGAASTVLRGLHIAGSGEFTIANYTLSDVDATNATNIIDGYRVPDDNFEIEARLRHGTSDARLGIIHLAPDSVYAIASRSLATTVSAAAANDTIHVSDGSHVLDSTISIPGSKALTMRGQSWAAEVSAPASGPSIYFDVYGSGTTIEGLSLISLGGTNPQNLIGIKGADVSIRNNSFSGVYADGDGAVSRAIEVSPGVQNVTIDGNTIHGLRQPAYFNPGVAGRVTNNRVFGTRGWVVDGALVDFSGNTWRETGTGVSENYGCDIALLVGTTSSAPYDDLVALAAANGGILLNLTDGSSSCDQR